MKIAVTGASGFIGTHAVAELRRGGHTVVAVARPASPSVPASWASDSGVKILRHDLRERRGLAEALTGVDAVIHLAAVKGGDFHAQFAGTVVGTENLLSAMSTAAIRRLVLVSSFSVYDYSTLHKGDLLDESVPVDHDRAGRDAYAVTKSLQEALAARAAKDGRFDLTIVRPGMVYGRGNLWNPCLGIDLGRTFVRVGRRSQMPLTFVENCAEAIALAVERQEAVGEVLNIVDDHLPSRGRFSGVLKGCDASRPAVVPLTWGVTRGVAAVAWAVNICLFGGAARLPSFLVPAQVAARFAPLRYSNERAKRTLGWAPRYGFEEAIQRSLPNGRAADG